MKWPSEIASLPNFTFWQVYSFIDFEKQQGTVLNQGALVCDKYRQVSNIRRTKSQHLKDSRTLLRLSLSNPLKPDAKSRMKM